MRNQLKASKRKYSFKLHAIIHSLIGGTVLAAAAMDMAWRHNAQQEIYSESGINWGTWLAIGFPWFVGGCLLFFILSIPVYKFIIHVLIERAKQKNDL